MVTTYRGGAQRWEPCILCALESMSSAAHALATRLRVLLDDLAERLPPRPRDQGSEDDT